MLGRSARRMGVVMAALGALLGGSAAPAGAQVIQWISQFGGAQSDFATGIVRGKDDSRYVVGFTTGALPGQQSFGGTDAFIRKYDPQGNVAWDRQFGTLGPNGEPRTDMALAVALSTEDDGDFEGIYVAGFVGGTLPGQQSAGGNDAFVRKYNPAGVEIWTRQFGTSEHDEVSAVGIDSNSAVVVAGSTLGSLAGPNAGRADAFVRKYRPTGVLEWTRQFGTAEGDAALGVAVKGDRIYVAGLTAGTLLGQTSAGGVDAFVRRYDHLGREKWTRQFGTAAFDELWGVAIGPEGSVYVAGGTGGELPGQHSAGRFDAFVRKYSPTGVVKWTRQFGTAEDDEALNIAVGPDGSVYAVGVTGGALDGHPSHGSFDGFVRRFGAAGTHRATAQIGTAGYDEIDAIQVAVNGDVYIAGSTTGTFEGQQSAGAEDVFVLKFTPATK